MGRWRYDSIVFNLVSRWRWGVSITLVPLYSRGKELQYPMGRSAGGPRGSLITVEKKFLVPVGSQTKSVAIPTELNDKSYGVCLNYKFDRQYRKNGFCPDHGALCKKFETRVWSRPVAHTRQYIPDNRYLSSVGSILVWVAFYVPSAVLCYTGTMKPPPATWLFFWTHRRTQTIKCWSNK